MAADMVDDLHAAEDRLGLLQVALDGFLNISDIGDYNYFHEKYSYLGDGRYCRPSCNFVDTGECEDEDPDCCGCPCGHGKDE